MKKVLQEEISRLAKKEFKNLIAPYEQKLKDKDQAIAEWKKKLIDLDRRKADKPDPYKLPNAKAIASEVKDYQLKPRNLFAIRKRFGLTIGKMAAILDVSYQSYFNWESGKAIPHANSKAKLILLSKLKKRAFNKLYKNKLDALDKKSEGKPKATPETLQASAVVASKS